MTLLFPSSQLLHVFLPFDAADMIAFSAKSTLWLLDSSPRAPSPTLPSLCRSRTFIFAQSCLLTIITCSMAFPALTATVDGNMAKLVPADMSVLDTDKQLYAIWIGYPENAVGEYNKKTMQVTLVCCFSPVVLCSRSLVVYSLKGLRASNILSFPRKRPSPMMPQYVFIISTNLSSAHLSSSGRRACRCRHQQLLTDSTGNHVD